MSLAVTSTQTFSLRARAGVPAEKHLVSELGVGEPSLRLSPACVNSTDLLRGQKAVEINHNGFTYRLQATRLGKLILTK